MLQVYPVYLLWNRRKTLTGSQDPTHANGTNKPCNCRWFCLISHYTCPGAFTEEPCLLDIPFAHHHVLKPYRLQYKLWWDQAESFSILSALYELLFLCYFVSDVHLLLTHPFPDQVVQGFVTDSHLWAGLPTSAAAEESIPVHHLRKKKYFQNK